jgi:hypothetical protein
VAALEIAAADTKEEPATFLATTSATQTTASAQPLPTPLATPTETYTDPDQGFSFDYPKGLKVTVTDDGDSRYVFGNTSRGDTHFMIVSYPYPYATPLTEDVIRGESFAADFTGPITRKVLPSGVTAFLSGRADTPLGATRDALFDYDEIAGFQVSVPSDLEGLFNEIVESWRFISPR